jgi:hypothetical protein
MQLFDTLKNPWLAAPEAQACLGYDQRKPSNKVWWCIRAAEPLCLLGCLTKETTHRHTERHIRTRTCAHTHSHTQRHTQRDIRTRTCARTHTCEHTHTHTHTHTHRETHIHTNTQTHTHTHAHKHIHTRTHTRPQHDQHLADRDLMDLVYFGRTLLARMDKPMSHKVTKRTLHYTLHTDTYQILHYTLTLTNYCITH